MTEQKTDEWELHYWGNVKNRGSYIRLIFAATNTTFKESGTPDCIEAFDQNTKNEFGNYPVFAFPCLRKGKVVLGQTEICTRWAAQECGLEPDDKIDKLRASQVIANCNDLQRELLGKIFGGAKKEELDKFWSIDPDKHKGRDSRRVDKFLQVLAKPLDMDDSVYYFGKKLSYADTSAFNMLDALKEMMGDKAYEERVAKRYPKLAKLYTEVGKQEGIAKMLKQQKEKKQNWWPGMPPFKKMVTTMGWTDSILYDEKTKS